ncbi:UAP56-interacting factor isoform X1 [Polypterus senegalus]|uniref:UAP56-interacting factor isoform X1 n=1 Tax=Polypterus senegalus TaxID=55291 RepID=UPI001962A02D|nr:UAP56-interacting factor isoform X1 [Polypterus senegalus]
MGDAELDAGTMEVDEDSQKIDMSLDDIIKLGDAEQTFLQSSPNENLQQHGNRRLRKRKTFGKNQFNARKGLPQIPQEPYRLRSRNEMQQKFNRRPPYNLRRSGPGINSPLPSTSMSPINRIPLRGKSNLAGISGGVNTQGKQLQFLKAQPRLRRKFWQPNAGPQQTLRRFPQQNRALRLQQLQQRQKNQRQNHVNLNRGFNIQQVDGTFTEKRNKMRRWRQPPTSGSVLTVSVPNPKATKDTMASRLRFKQSSVPSDRQTEAADEAHPQPKGIPLRFNFKAVANQTAITLNERFSSLQIKGGSVMPRRGRRTVTLQ